MNQLMILFTLLGVKANAAVPFYVKRQAIVRMRLVEAFGCSDVKGLSPRLQSELNLSGSAVHGLLFHERKILTLGQARTLSLASGETIDHLLATDLFERYHSLDSFESAIKGVANTPQNVLIDLFVRKLERDRPRRSRADRVPRPDEFMARWRSVIRRRLLQRVQIRAKRNNAQVAFVVEVARLLSRDPAYVSKILNGPHYLTWDDATILADHFGVRAKWILAADVVGEFPSVDAIEETLKDERAPVRALMVRLYGKHHWPAGCVDKLKSTPPPT